MADDQFFKEQTEVNVFLQLMQRYMPFWPLFVITTTLSLAVAFVYVRSQQRIYVASSKVLLKDPNKGTGETKILEALNIFGDQKVVDNEVVVLRSSNLMQEVVRDLHLYAYVYNEGKVRVEELYKENSPVWFRTTQPEKLSQSKKYYFKVDWNRQLINIDNKTVHFNDSLVLNNCVIIVEPNPAYPKNLAGKNYYVEFNSVYGASMSIINDLKATPFSVQSTVLDVRLETPVPQKGIDILTKLFQVYIARGIEDKNETAARTLAFIDARLVDVSSSLDSVEKNVQNYKSQNQVIDLSTQGQLFLTLVGESDRAKAEADLKLNVLNEVSSYINSQDKKTGTVPSLAFSKDPVLMSLIEKLKDAELQLQKSRAIGGEKSDAVVFAQQMVDQLHTDIKENIESNRRTILASRNAASSIINTNNSLLNGIPKKERGLVDVKREQAIKNYIYNYLLQKREETSLNSASTIADLRIVESASAIGPIKPVVKNFYVGGLMVGIFLAILIVLVREQLNRKVLFRSEIEEKTKVPVVGEIIQIASKDPIVILEGKRTIIAEQFRSLRTNLSFMALNEDAKTTLITSNISGEGKSFISINLAISHTLTNKKVALLELDLRKPRLSNLLGVTRDPGISNYLVGKIPLDGIIKETKIKNLSVISAGAIPPNPSELILSNKFKEMIAELKLKFDYLVMDSAPIGPVSDSLLLKDHADTTIFVVRHNITPKIYLKQIEGLNQQKKFDNMCIVFNGLKRRGIGGNYGYGGYGNYGNYGSGYGYGYGSQDYYVSDAKKSFFSRFKNFFRK